MPQLLSRRTLIGAGGVAAIAPIVLDGAIATAVPLPKVLTGPVYTLIDPVRVFDSRIAPPEIGGGRLATGGVVGVPMGAAVDAVSDGTHSPMAVYVNVTVTDTAGFGYLVLYPSDLTGEKPVPQTSNINWSTYGETLANLALVAVGGETYIVIRAGGNGSTHFIIDLQGYVPQPV